MQRLQRADLKSNDVIGIASMNHRAHIDLMTIASTLDLTIAWGVCDDTTLTPDIPIRDWSLGFFDDRHLCFSIGAPNCTIHRMGEYETWLSATAAVNDYGASSRAIARLLTTSSVPTRLERPNTVPLADDAKATIANVPNPRLLVAESLADRYWRNFTLSAINAGVDVVLLPQRHNHTDFMRALSQKPTAMAMSQSSASLFAEFMDDDAHWLNLPRWLGNDDPTSVDRLLSG